MSDNRELEAYNRQVILRCPISRSLSAGMPSQDTVLYDDFRSFMRGQYRVMADSSLQTYKRLSQWMTLGSILAMPVGLMDLNEQFNHDAAQLEYDAELYKTCAVLVLAASTCVITSLTNIEVRSEQRIRQS